MALTLARLKKNIDALCGAAGVLKHIPVDNAQIPCPYSELLQQCIDMRQLTQGRRLFLHMIKAGNTGSPYLLTKVLILHVKCATLEEARQLFDKMPTKTAVSWNAMLSAYAQTGSTGNLFCLFSDMNRTRQPDPFTLAILLRGCTHSFKQPFQNAKKNGAQSLKQCKVIHGQILKREFTTDAVLMASLVSAYAKSDATMDWARQVFDKMSNRSVVAWTSLVDGYCKLGMMQDAMSIFEAMPDKDAVAWSAMIEGLAHHKLGDDALRLFMNMRRCGDIVPKQSTFLSTLNACIHITGLEQGMQIHACMIKSIYPYDTPMLLTAVLDMYAKCGCLDSASLIFWKMREKNVVSWTCMIDAYGKHGLCNEAISCFHKMIDGGYKPNLVTFLSILSACSHGGLVKEGLDYLKSLKDDYGLVPQQEHYACIVDILGRAGRLDEAWDFVHGMPVEAGENVWAALLGACRMHGETQKAKYAAEKLLVLNHKRPGLYVSLANIYAASGNWDEASNLRRAMSERGVEKETAYSWIEVDKKMHRFKTHDTSHPLSHEIYGMLERLTGQMKEGGYVPNQSLTLHDVDEEQKQSAMCYHSERLAIAFGMLKVPPPKPIRVMKNLRVCVDCHEATKLISKITDRQIIVRDAQRFHYFANGACSCSDYW